MKRFLFFFLFLALPAFAVTTVIVENDQTITNYKRFNDGKLVLKGSSTGSIVLHAPAASGVTANVSFPAVDGIAALLEADNQWTSPSNAFLHGLNVTAGVGEVFGITGGGDITFANTGVLTINGQNSILLGAGAGGLVLQSTDDVTISSGSGTVSITPTLLSGGTTIQDEVDVSDAAFDGPFVIRDTLDVGGLSTLHETQYFVTAADKVPISITAHVSQTGNLFEIHNNADVIQYKVDSSFNVDLRGHSITTGNVIIGGGASVSESRYLEASGNGVNYTGFKAPDSLAANVIYKLPTADGAVGQVITTDGSKNLGWTGKSVADCLQLFGTGSDGNIAAGAGTTTLTRDMYYNNVTLITGDKIITAGYRLFIAGILDITAADARAIQHTASGGMDGGNAVTSTAGAIPTQATNTVGSLAQIIRGLAGKAGTTTTGTNGSAGGSTSPGNGGTGGASGAGGTGNGGAVAGGTTAAGGVTSNASPILRAGVDLIKGVTLLGGGGSGASGGGGGGVIGGASGGSGGSGSGGAVALLSINTVNRGAGTPASCIEFRGGNGGNGGAGTVNTDGGGGGSGGGGGGWPHIIVGSLTGATATNCIDASGGNGGGGGAGLTTGIGGNGGHGGNGGRITLINIGANTITHVDNTAVADTGTSAGSGTTGGTGGTGAPTLLSL